MAAPRVYRWDDGNAPVARGERRSMCDILYACLVTGYGTKPGAGWTRPFVNATFDKAVFRNNPVAGTGLYLQVDGAGAPNAYTSLLQGYEVMTSESTGLMPFNAAAASGLTSSAAGSTARPWVLVADDRFFWFVCWSSITTTPTAANVSVSAGFFGDVVPWKTPDPYGCALVFATLNGSYGVAYGSHLAAATYGTSGFAMPRKQDGSAGSIVPMAIVGGGPGAASGGAMGGQGVPYSPGGQILLSRPFINEAAAYTMRGWLPGLYCPCHPLAFEQLATINIDGKSFLSLRHNVGGNAAGANYFISLDDWWV